MSITYTPTRKSYYQKHKKEIKKQRKLNYQKNLLQERATSLDRHYKNQKRNNSTSLVHYHTNDKKLNKIRQNRRSKRQPKVKCMMCKNKFHTKKNPDAPLSKNKPQCPKCGDRIIIFID